MKRNNGFTLIELMVVVAIIGILAAIAIPAYQDYISRSKITEALVNMDAARVEISSYVATSDGNLLPTVSQDPLALPGNAHYISQLTWTGAEIQATLFDINPQVNGKQLMLVPRSSTDLNNPALSWSCTTTLDASAYRFLPSNCRNAGT